MAKGRPATRRLQVLAVIDAAAVLGQTPSYGEIARQTGIKDWRDAKRICRALNWPSDFSPVLRARKVL
jgi:hypothetical protein